MTNEELKNKLILGDNIGRNVIDNFKSAGVEFFSWDFSHKPEDGFKADIYLDNKGKQVRKLHPGDHHIAVEAVDKHGLDGKDTIKLKVKELN